MKCDHCASSMSLSSMVCTSSCCSFSYECGICGSQRLTSEPIPAGQRSAARWPDKSGYNPGKNIAPDHQARHILGDTAENNRNHSKHRNHLSGPQLSLDSTTDHSTADRVDDETIPLLESASTDTLAAIENAESVEDLARDFSYS